MVLPFLRMPSGLVGFAADSATRAFTVAIFVSLCRWYKG